MALGWFLFWQKVKNPVKAPSSGSESDAALDEDEDKKVSDNKRQSFSKSGATRSAASTQSNNKSAVKRSQQQRGSVESSADEESGEDRNYRAQPVPAKKKAMVCCTVFSL